MSEYYKELEEEEQQIEAFDKNLKKKKDHFLTRTLQLVFSVSIFSLVLCYSSGLSFFPHSFNVYFSTFLFSFFTHTLERKYMFLICNGILAFLAKSSSPSSTTSYSSSDYLAAAVAAAAHYQLSTSDLPAEINEQVCVEDVESTSSSASACHKINGGDVRVENVESLAKISLQAEKEEEEEEELAAEETMQAKQKGHVEVIEDEESVIAQEEEEEEDNYTGEAEAEDNYTGEAEAKAEAVALNEPSTDELNKKIEEFIRKMKEEIRIEAQRPLVAV